MAQSYVNPHCPNDSTPCALSAESNCVACDRVFGDFDAKEHAAEHPVMDCIMPGVHASGCRCTWNSAAEDDEARRLSELVAQPLRCYENSDGICVAPHDVCCGRSASR